MDMLKLRIRKLMQMFLDRQKLFSTGKEVKSDTITTNPLDKDLLERAMNCVNRNLDNTEYTVEKFSAEMHMDRTGLYRKLMALTGQSPRDFIRTIRLNRAAELLSRPNAIVSQVAEEVGFNSVLFFKKLPGKIRRFSEPIWSIAWFLGCLSGKSTCVTIVSTWVFNFLAHTCTFAGNKRFNMPRKSHIMHQPKVAVFDIFNLAFSGSSEAISSAFQSTKPGRRKRNRKVALPGNVQSGTHATTDTPLMQRSARIAVLVESLSDHYTNKIISGIEAAADKTGYEIAILNILGKQLSLVGLDSFEGFIACCSDGASVDPRFFEELGKPVIVVGNVENVNGYHCVKTDYQKGAQLAVNHLIDQGCENIMMINSAVGNTATELDQYLGYRDALKKSGKSWQEPVRVSEATIEAGISIAAQMFENDDLPDGVFISNDWVAAGFVKYLKKKGKRSQ